MDVVAKVATVAAIIGLFAASGVQADAIWVTPGWAGYVVRAGDSSFRRVEGSWTQPRIVCNRPESSVAVWVGLGGASSSSHTLEQVGTSADCSQRGLVSYSAWYQLFPAPPVDVPIRVRPGDTLRAAVSVDGWAVSVTIANVSTGDTFSAQRWTPAPETDSAEWIVEAPAACLTTCVAMPLADFSRVRFRDAATSIQTHTGTIDDSAWARLRLQMAPELRRTVAAASGLSADGSSFSVVRLRPSGLG
jgi:Peptidase A4 family